MAQFQDRNTVLFVDDEIHILNAIRRATIDEPYDCVFANSGQEALKVLKEREIGVIVTDMRMPGVDGLTLLKTVCEKYPKTVRIVLSGYTQQSQILATVNHGDIFQFIPKPWKMEEELLMVIHQALIRYDVEIERHRLQQGLTQKNKVYQNIFRTMEQKLANEKKDLTNLKHVNHWTFSFWKKQLEMGAELSAEANLTILKSYVDLIEELELLYIDILPTFTEVKTTEDIIADITKACVGRIDISSNGNADEKFSGYYGFLIMACKALIYLLEDDAKMQVKCEMMIDANNEKTTNVDFVFSLQPLELSAGNQNRLKVGCSLLSEMGKIYNLDVQPELVQGNVISVRVAWIADKG